MAAVALIGRLFLNLARVIIVIIAFSLFYIHMLSSYRMLDSTYSDITDIPPSEERRISLPFRATSAYSQKYALRKNARTYQFNLYTIGYSGQFMMLKVFTDDCITAIKVNTIEVPFDKRHKAEVCSAAKGVVFNIGEYARSGQNIVSVILTDVNGGTFNLNAKPVLLYENRDLFNRFKLRHIVFIWALSIVLLQIFIKLREEQ
jgi:hypothetical protein